MRAEPLPMAATNLLEKSIDILRALSEQQTDNVADALERLKLEDSVSKNIQMAIDTFQSQLQEALGTSIDVSQIWAFGPRKCGPNILLNKIPSMVFPTSKKTFIYHSTNILFFRLHKICMEAKRQCQPCIDKV